MSQKDFELLAPAGSFEILKAVIAAGADAVYVGGDLFGARAYANNFPKEELLEALDYAHIRGKQIYLTVNTLLKNQELKEKLYDYLLPYYERGLDAVIVQDLGALVFIHECFPDMPIHTSTQMTVTGIEGVRFLQQYGVTRVVMAREVSLDEMKSIHEETGMELEAFVHGALCYSYSGQCLFSSILGGRSGNRGRCAQPCRLSYEVLDEKKKSYRKDSFVLSMKDMCGLEDLAELKEAGVYSLKIEGRMKQIDYAAGVVSVYRRNIDRLEQGRNIDKADVTQLLKLGNRCGFTNGYYHKHNGKDMVTFEKPSYEKEETGAIILTKSQIPVSGYAVMKQGQSARLTLFLGEESVQVEVGEVSAAKNKPMTREDILSRLNKTGESDFYFASLELEMDEHIFIPNGALNQLRREAFERLSKKILDKYVRDSSNNSAEIQQQTADFKRRENAHISVSTENRQLFSVFLENEKISRIYIDSNAYSRKNIKEEWEQDVRLAEKAGKEIYLMLPHIFRKETSQFYTSKIEIWKKNSPTGFVVRNYEELYWVRNNFPKAKIVSDYNLYTFNDLAQKELKKQGVFLTTMPYELNKKEIDNRSNMDTEMVIYGYYPLMISAQCVHKNTKGCDKTKTICFLKDRYQAQFPVKNHCNECYNVIYNSLPVCLFSNLKQLENAGIKDFRLSFTIETKEEAKAILEVMNRFDREMISFTNGHYKRGVE